MRTRFVLGGLAVLMAAAAPAMGLTPAEQELLAKLPVGVHRFCDSDPAPPSSLAVAAIVCDTPTSVGVIAQYSSYASYQDLMTAYFAVSALMTGRAQTNYGTCGDGVPPGERISSEDGFPTGRWTCYVRGGEAGLVWTRAGIPVLSWARRPDSRFPQLLSWHRQVSPRSPVVVATQGLAGALDRRLLADISPEVAAGNCVRVARPADAPWTNALRCDRLGGGDVTYRRYPDRDAAAADYDRTLRSLRVPLRIGGTCTGPRPTERPYPSRGTARGRFACSTDAKGRARLDWVDNARLIRGVVRVPGASQAAVLGWWRGHPR